MKGEISVTFLGTSSGGGPSESRNCSSLVCDVTGNSSLWMVDCAEGTLRQFALQDRKLTSLKVNSVSKMFITHMHADHIMGIVPLLRNILFPPPVGGPTSTSHVPKSPKIQIYGPSGLRNFVRQIMKMTLTKTAEFYVVHELLTKTDQITPCLPHDAIDGLHLPDVMHYNEIAGRDIVCTEDGLWQEFMTSNGIYGEICVDAGPILHRDPCVGYVIREKFGPMRKLVILGDTYDPSAMIPLCVSPSPSLLIHEATDAHIPHHVDYNARRSSETVMATALARGHSIPTMAGAFAKQIGAERLVMNHISPRFPVPRFERDHRSAVISEIERQATEAWGSGTRAIAAYDYMTIRISPTLSNDGPAHVSPEYQVAGGAEAVTMQLHHADPAEGFLYAVRDRSQGFQDRSCNGNRDRKRRR
ncbi:Zinc phosphodiesterase ELAC protein 1 [Termitomyces sp. J132]|nr:Zinc phosphodiesterase ELAC protein 1 [Termitomyces sp. J132]